MANFDKVPLPDYTRAEDTVNSVTHYVGVPMTLAFTFLLLKKLRFAPTGMQTAALIIYTLCMLILYFGSGYYHGLKPSYKKRVARVLDHSNIFVMISGTLTAFNLMAAINKTPRLAVSVTVVMWIISVIGIYFTFKDLHRFRKVQMAMYIIMGWSALATVIPMIVSGGEAEKKLIIYVLGGGIAYTVGAVLYGIGKKIRYIHAVFHVFILAGSVIQFIGFYHYL